ncbi:MAG: alpha-galactosidase [Planctomycetota bacterium]
MILRLRFGLCAFLIATLALEALAQEGIAPRPDEFRLRDRWLDPLFGRAPAPAAPHLELLFEDVGDALARGRSWRGTPFQLGERTYAHGLAFNSNKNLRVVLDRPAERFVAEVGLENNDDTRRGATAGHGSVTFHVLSGGAERYASPVLRLEDGPRPISVPLNGASEFEIRVADGGDGRSWDQALWGEAKVVLGDGREIRLQDLPLDEPFGSPLSPAQPPFSFVYGGRNSAELLPKWRVESSSRALDAERTEHRLVYTDPDTGLELCCAAVEYHDYPAVEWTLYFRNMGPEKTPILEAIQAFDVELYRGGGGEFLLHHNVGSPADGNDYRPLETPLGEGAAKHLGGTGGRPTNADWSYFNVEGGDRGLIVAIGWPGQWAAELARRGARSLHLAAGQELTHFSLLPGEEARTPLVALLFWNGEWIRSQNVWRRWMKAHSMPRPGDKLPPPQLLASSSRQFAEMIQANEENQVAFLDRYLEEGLRLDYWWMDAGWYVHDGRGWPCVGTWEVDAARFPRGLRAVSDHAHERGVKTLLWFEPERVAAGTWLAENHPEWILGGARGGLLNLGDDDARRWVTDHVDGILTAQGIDLYRQDFNIDPLGYWRAADAADRQGLSEIRHVSGYLAYWDELLRRHPELLIDSCASGGRRNDLETMRRAVPLWRSDYAFEAIGHQCMTYGLSLWLPFHGTGTVATRSAPYYGSGSTPVEPYAFWSNAAPSLVLAVDVREDLDYAALRRLVEAWRVVAPNFYGDFYPLTPWSRDASLWMAWQFDRPEVGEGIVQVFRRDGSIYEAARFRLHGLEPATTYVVSNLGALTSEERGGAELMEVGLLIEIAAQPGAAVIRYQRR